jgi:hypothetical protein
MGWCFNHQPTGDHMQMRKRHRHTARRPCNVSAPGYDHAQRERATARLAKQPLYFKPFAGLSLAAS